MTRHDTTRHDTTTKMARHNTTTKADKMIEKIPRFEGNHQAYLNYLYSSEWRKAGYVYWIDEKGNICGKDMLKGQSK